MDRVTVRLAGGIAHVRLNRPDKMNAMDDAMMDAIIAAGSEVAALGARVVVLSGAGKAFCAGLDVKSFAAMANRDPQALVMPRTHGPANKYQEVALVWRTLPVPVIAALHGVVFGAGFQLALGADIRIAAPETQLAVMEMKWGLVPDMAGIVLMPKLTGTDVMARLTYSGAPVSAVQARDWGLVTELADDPLAAAQGLAETIAQKSPSAIRAAKRLIMGTAGMAEAEVLLAESREQAALIGKPDQVEVIAAQMQRRDPVFK